VVVGVNVTAVTDEAEATVSKPITATLEENSATTSATGIKPINLFRMPTRIIV
jgi:hypothetical protein